MKSSIKITVMSVGLIAAVVVSAVASSAGSKISSVNSKLKSGSSSDETVEVTEPIELASVETEYRLLLSDESGVYPDKNASVSSAESAKTASSEKSADKTSKKTETNSVKNTESAKSESKTTVSKATEEKKTESQPTSQLKVVEPFSIGSFLPIIQEVSAPTVKDGGTYTAAKRNEANEEVLWVNGNIYPLKEGLKRITSHEVNEGMNYEAIKAQAICSHTYVRYYNDVKKCSASVGMSSSYKVGGLVDRAVEEVYNKILTYNGSPIYSPYCSQTCGSTQSSKEVWGGSLPYLTAKVSKYDIYAPKFESTKTFSAETIKSKVKSTYGLNLSDDPSTWFKFLSAEQGGYTSGGYVNKISVGGKTTTGVKIRGMLGLRSACFTISYKNGNFTFTTHGYGHGVGFSQWGAHYYAVKDGWDCFKIVTHYFNGVAVAIAV